MKVFDYLGETRRMQV